MKAIIVGAGEVGYHMADRLSKEGHEVTLIEQDANREGHLREKINANVIQGSGASAEVLESAGIEDTEIFIAVTEIDEVNMIACLLAREFKVPTKIARVNSIEFTNSQSKVNAEKLGIDLLINPQYVVANEICEIVEYTEALEAAEFAEGRVVFLGYPIREETPLVDRSLKDLALSKGDSRMVVTSIVRDDKTIVPTGSDVVKVGDILHLICNKEDIDAVRKLFGLKRKEAKKIFILGAGHVGYEVARRLADGTHEVKVIDKSDRHCREMAEKLEDVLVLNTNSTDVDTLKNEGISKADCFISVTDDDQSNILGSLLAKRHGVRRAITLVNQPELQSLAQSLDIGACISPRLATASAILKYIRSGNVISMLEQNNAEILELQLRTESKILNRPISEIQVPKGVLIGAIVRGDEVIIPGGRDVLELNDRVIIFTLLKSIQKAESFFSK